MSDLSDTLLKTFCDEELDDTTRSFLLELQRLRSEQAAGREHIERVVRDTIEDDVAENGMVIGDTDWNRIARRVASRLSVPVLRRRDQAIRDFVAQHGATTDLRDEDLVYLWTNVGGDSGFVRPLIAEIQRRRKADSSVPVLSEDVRRGLCLIKGHFDEDGHNWTAGTEMADVRAAFAWIDRLIAAGKP